MYVSLLNTVFSLNKLLLRVFWSLGICFCESSVKQRESKPNSGRERKTAVEEGTQETDREKDREIKTVREKEAVYVSEIANIVDNAVVEMSA